MDIEKLDINGQSLNIRDGKAVHVDESDSLTEEEKTRVRQNIGAAKAGSGGSLSAQIVDNKLVVTLTGSLSASILDGVLVVEG